MLWRMPADLRRERIGMMFINIDASRGCTMRGAGSRLVDGRQMTGGNAGNLTFEWSGQLCSPNASPYSGTKEFPVVVARSRAIPCRRTADASSRPTLLRSAKPLAGIAEIPWIPMTAAAARRFFARFATPTMVRKYQIFGRRSLRWRNVVSSCRRMASHPKECISSFQAKYASKTQIYQSIDIIYRSI
jgi:hypothetical protein